MATVYIPAEHKDLAERLAGSKKTISGFTIFQTYMHLTVFAANVGYHFSQSKDLPSREKGAEIYQDIFEKYNLSGMAYLLSLHETKSGDVLRSDSETDPWKILERYSNSGFDIISGWLQENPSTPEEEVLINKMKEIASENTTNNQPPLSPDIDV